MKDEMKLLFIIPSYSSYRTFLTDLGRRLLANGAEVHVVCGKSMGDGDVRKSASEDGVRFHWIEMPRGLSPWSHLQAAWRLRKLVRELKPSLIHAHFSAAIFTAALAKERKWPVLLATYQGLSFPLIEGLKKWPVRFAEIWSSRRCDGVWVLTDDDVTALQGRVAPSLVHLQQSPGFGCVVSRFNLARFDEHQRLNLREAYSLGAEDVVFIYVGRWLGFKGFGLVVRAFRRVSLKYDNARLLLVGGADPLHDSGLSKDEEQSLRGNEKIVIAGWQSDVSPYLAIADVMAFPSEREGMPVCIMEALSMGLPVITSDSRGCRELVEHGVNGLVVKRNEEAVIHAMLQVLRDRDAVLRMSKEAVRGSSQYDRNVYINEQIMIYDRYSNE